MRTSSHNIQTGQVTTVGAPLGEHPAKQTSPALITPDAPRSTPIQTNPAPTTPSTLGAFLGRAAKAVAAVTLGTALVTGTVGCAMTPVEPFSPELAEQHVNRFVKTEAGWAVRGMSDAGALPASVGEILEQAAEARHSVDGQWAYVLDADGGYGFTSAWSGFEVRDIAKSLEGLLASGDLKTADPRAANAFLHEMVDIFPEVGPTQDAGMGFTRAYMRDLEKVVLALDAQVRAD